VKGPVDFDCPPRRARAACSARVGGNIEAAL